MRTRDLIEFIRTIPDGENILLPITVSCKSHEIDQFLFDLHHLLVAKMPDTVVLWWNTNDIVSKEMIRNLVALIRKALVPSVAFDLNIKYPGYLKSIDNIMSVVDEINAMGDSCFTASILQDREARPVPTALAMPQPIKLAPPLIESHSSPSMHLKLSRAIKPTSPLGLHSFLSRAASAPARAELSEHMQYESIASESVVVLDGAKRGPG